MRSCIALVLLLAGLAPGACLAQPGVSEARPYRQGVGRGLLYGTHLISPIYVTPLDRGGGRADVLSVGAGGGLQARAGWELGDGLSVELYGGLSFNELAAVPGEPATRSHALGQGHVALALRYSWFFGSVFVPFVQVAVGARFLFFSWGSSDEERPAAAPLVSGALGAHFQIAPFFGVEVGAHVDYTFGGDTFEQGYVTISPFIGVTLYLFDESE